MSPTRSECSAVVASPCTAAKPFFGPLFACISSVLRALKLSGCCQSSIVVHRTSLHASSVQQFCFGKGKALGTCQETGKGIANCVFIAEKNLDCHACWRGLSSLQFEYYDLNIAAEFLGSRATWADRTAHALNQLTWDKIAVTLRNGRTVEDPLARGETAHWLVPFTKMDDRDEDDFRLGDVFSKQQLSALCTREL